MLPATKQNMDIFSAILNLERSSKSLYWFKSYGDFAKLVDSCLLVELHREVFAPAACAAGLFFDGFPYLIVPKTDVTKTELKSATIKIS